VQVLLLLPLGGVGAAVGEGCLGGAAGAVSHGVSEGAWACRGVCLGLITGRWGHFCLGVGLITAGLGCCSV
jgi:hypothetical protein